MSSRIRTGEVIRRGIPVPPTQGTGRSSPTWCQVAWGLDNGEQVGRTREAAWRRRWLHLRRLVWIVAILFSGSACTGTAQTATRPSTPPAVAVPNVQGMALTMALDKLKTVGLSGSIGGYQSTQMVAANGIVSQTPQAGASVPSGTVVKLILAQTPKATVPSLLGLSLSSAESEVQQAGLKIHVGGHRVVWPFPAPGVEVSFYPAGTVITQSVQPDTEVDLGTVIRVVIGKAPRCDPDYTGACLDPNAFDYDCLGGTGDGPKWTGVVRIVGFDRFRLDGDGNGYGCDG